MSSATPPYPQQPAQPAASTNVVVKHPPPNNLGLAGFITSILGLVTCGVLAPVGLLLSLIGLFKQPRGFAIAGTIIGIIGSVFLALVGVSIVLGVLGLGAAAKFLKETATTHEQAMKLYAELEQQRATAGAGATISSTTASALAAKYNDGWGTPLRAQVASGNVTIISAGRDKKFDTDDDLSFDETQLSATTMPSTTQPGGAGGERGTNAND